MCAADVGVCLLVRKVGGVGIDAEWPAACKSGEGKTRNAQLIRVCRCVHDLDACFELLLKLWFG